jgi:hypothetical protein
MTAQQPIIVKIVEPADDPISGLADVLIGALGLTGALVVIAAALGLLVAGVLFWIRSRSPLSHS